MAEGGIVPDYRYTVVLLEGVPQFSDNTSQEIRQKTLLQFGYYMGLTNIESVSIVKGQAVYKLYQGFENVSELLTCKSDNVHILYQLTISDKITIKLNEPMTELFHIARNAYIHLAFVNEIEDGTVIVGPPESVSAFCDFLNEQFAEAIQTKSKGAFANSLTAREDVASGNAQWQNEQSVKKENDHKVLQPYQEAKVATQKENPDELVKHDDVPASAKHIKKSLSTTEQSVYDNMSPDALSLLEKSPAGQIKGVHYDSRAGRILIDKETPEKENERITLFQNAFQTITAKLKISHVPIPATTSLDTMSELVEAYNNQYNMCVFTIQEGCIKIVSNSSRQCDQAVTLLTKDMAGKREVIQLPDARTLTLKKANIVTEKVDIIVNPANDRLSHAGGVAAALDKASKRKLQKLCDNHIRQKGPVNVGCIAITAGGGDLKCDKVIHAVGPRFALYQIDAYYEHYLNAVVQEALKGAERYNAESIAFPAISTGIFGVKKELVARCLVNTIVAYKFSKPHPVLSDIRIVIIDDDTYDPFALYCQQKQRELTSTVKLSSPIKPAKFTPPKKAIDPSTSTATGKAPASVATLPVKMLSFRDSKEIETALKGLANEWRLLGTKLGFSKGILDKISSVSANDSVYLNRLLIQWLSGDAGSPITVSKLVDALGKMGGKDEYVCKILHGFIDDPLASAIPHAGDSNDSLKNDDATTDTVSANDLTKISYPKDDPMDGLSVNEEQSGGDKGATSSTGSSQYENQHNPSLTLSSACTSSSLCVTTTSLMSTVTTSTSSSVVPSPPLGMPNQSAILSGYNDGQPYRCTDRQKEEMSSQGGGTKDQMLQYPFKGRGGSGCQIGSKDVTQFSKTPKGRGAPVYPNATESPYPKDLGAHQGGGGATGMNYSGAVTKQGMEAAAVTTHPQANTNHAVPSSTKDSRDHSKQEEDECPICMSEYKDPVKTKCGHIFCRECIDQSLQYNSLCPICKTAIKDVIGNQPNDGQMIVQFSRQRLPGYYDCGTIKIHYDIPSGTQGKEHPNPGQRYTGVMRTAYLPDNREGREVLELLEKAFYARLIFTVGTSITSGLSNTVTWNDIHHKTSTHGGPQNYGYPDPGYLKRVKEDLAAKGIVP